MGNYSILSTLYKNDSPEYLRQSIESMLSQTIVTNDYVLVADGPISLELEDVLKEYECKYDFFNVVRLAQNVGLGAALNEGLKVCKNDLVARLDADDISLPTRCEEQLSAFEKDGELVIVGTDMYEFDDDPDKVVSLKQMPYTHEQIYKFGKRRNPFNHSSVMYKKSVIMELGGYANLRRSQDIELWARVLYAGNKCLNIDKPLIKFRCGGSRVQRKKKWSNVKSDLKVFKKNYKMGYASFADYVYVWITQMAFFILPTKLAGKLYKKLFRKTPKNV